MKIKAQVAMVLNLDKCLGCHTCSIPCKNVWTNRAGTEYMWFNNVETKPGVGYPKKWEDQALRRGGWKAADGRLSLAAGGRVHKLLNIFHNPDQSPIDDYYEPWTYDYGKLTDTPARRHQPSIRPVSRITGENTDIRWGPNWEDDLAGVTETGGGDVNFKDLEWETYLRFQKVFMFYIPRLCEHCLNPACVASCPSGALYKRDEDGIVLVDQERCRGWRFCVSGCPYKKVYYNWKTGRSEKCLFCYPRVESGMTTLCAHSCVGRIRYVGVLLYDADLIGSAAAAAGEREIYPAQTAMFLDPADPKVIAEARSAGIPEPYLAAARRSPVHKLAVEWALAFPLHPEFRTLPMVWYVPPLSPVADLAEGPEETGAAVDRMRIPLTYLANLLTAGDPGPVRRALEKLVALRSHMRSLRTEGKPDTAGLDLAGMTPESAGEMYKLLAVAKYRDRFVVPTVHREREVDPYAFQGACGFR